MRDAEEAAAAAKASADGVVVDSRALDPEEVRRLGVALDAAIARQRNSGRMPVLVTSPDLRRYVRAFVERRSPSLAVVSFREIEPTTTIRPVETLSTGRN